ncbi:FkbM family methyltransferase [Streptosporangium sp. KLBMP 9127]|nr:FkbM family methyltransferase [Streptosporangium sp. KLBMP 9127]
MVEFASETWPSDACARWAERTPRAIAIECRGQTLTYQELDGATRLAADRLRRAGVPAGGLVALPAERDLETVAAIIGILRARCAYLPLDQDAPPDLLRQILHQAQPHLILAGARDLVALAGGPREPTEPLPPPPAAVAEPTPGLAYVMPTSGSGGALKLVEVGQSGVRHNLHALGAAVGGITPHDTYLHVASFAFSSSVRQLFLPLLYGARVVIATQHQRLDPHALLRLIRDSGVSVADLIPSLLSVLLDAVDGLPPREVAAALGNRLRMLLLASEPLPGRLVAAWRAASGRPDLAMFNMYGQTETAGIVCLHPLGSSDHTAPIVPIGTPLPGVEIELIDPGTSPAGDGLAEIAVAGPSLAFGYRGDPILTADRFTLGPGHDGVPARHYRTGDLGRLDERGVLAFAGRADRLIKVSGKRVDLAQIETALREHAAVAESAVVALPTEQGPRLLAFARLRDGYLSQDLSDRLRLLPNGLRIMDLHRAETDFMYEEIFEREIYLQHGIGLPADAYVIDAGANAGLFALSVAARYRHARVLAFEPALPTAGILKANLRANDCRNVTVRVQGLSDHTGTATLTWYPHSTGLSSVHADSSEELQTLTSIIANQVRHHALADRDELHDLLDDLAEAKLVQRSLPCRLTRLSDVIDAEGIDLIDLLKIDVQKSELDLLAGIDDRHWARIQQIVAEVHDIDGRLEVMTGLLTRRGYTVVTRQDVMFTGSALHYLYARRPGARRPDPAAPGLLGDQITAVSDRELSRHLADRLPSHATPATVTILDDLPRTASGKIDRGVLIRDVPTSLDTDDRHAASPLAAEIAALWGGVLGKPVGGGDDFFAIGGTSLSAARVITRVRRRYDLPDLPIRTLFDTPELDAFAAAVHDLLSPRELP